MTVQDPELQKICKRWAITSVQVFGSALRDDFNAQSDIDLIVEFEESAKISLFDLVEIERDFSALTHRPVDLVTLRALKNSKRPDRAQSILASAVKVYG